MSSEDEAPLPLANDTSAAGAAAPANDSDASPLLQPGADQPSARTSHRDLRAQYGGGGGRGLSLSGTSGGMRSGGLLSLPHILRSNHQFSSNVGLARLAFAGFVIGSFMTGSAFSIIFWPAVRHFAVYTLFLSVFHGMEFILTAIYHPNDLTFSSSILDHSREYHIALAASFIEYWIEYFLVPDSWRSSTLGVILCLIGLVCMVCGQLIRSLAMSTAAVSFTHQIAEEHKQEHTLITHGIYRYCRHPAYAGWFWWSVGTQFWLNNPVCILAYSFVVWKFFDGRIRYEEASLFQFFGASYKAYHTEVPFSGVPFITTPALM